MSLLDRSFTAPSLLSHRRITFSRSRPGTPTTDTETGDTIPGAPQSGSVQGWFSWMTSNERDNYKDDSAAYVLTRPGLLQAGDSITHASVGTFVVNEGNPRRQGGFDRADLRRA